MVLGVGVPETAYQQLQESAETVDVSLAAALVEHADIERYQADS